MKHFLLLLFTFFFTTTSFAKDACNGVDINSIKKHIDLIPNVKIVSKKDTSNLCQVTLKDDKSKKYFSIYAGENFVIAGNMFSNRIKTDDFEISKFKQQEIISKKEEIKKYIAIEKKPNGEIKHSLYAVTDPLCGHCKYALKELLPLIDVYGIHLKVILQNLYPPQSTQKAVEAVCQKISIEKYLSDNWIKETSPPSTQCIEGKEFIEKSGRLLNSLGITSVPFFIFEDGSSVLGANIKKVEEMLSSKPLIMK